MRAQRIVAATVAALILAAAGAAVPYGHLPLPANPSFLPAFGAFTLMTELVTATLLLSQAVVSRDRRPLRLGAAYLFSATILVPHMMAFPGVFAAAPLIGVSGSAVWLWVFWHAGLPAGMLWFIMGRPALLRRGDVAKVVAGVVAVVTALSLLATAGFEWLPTVLVGGSYQRINTLGIGPGVLALTLLASFLAVWRLRLRDTLPLWLAVALLAAVCDVGLTVLGGGRYTFGWYLARVLSLCTGVTVLIALLANLIAQSRRVETVNAQLEAMLRTDALTGLNNRRVFEDSLEHEWRRARREETAISLLVIDIDMFKGFNDRYGHPAGDVCLRQVAEAIGAQVQRPADLAARLGGEEFVILLPGTEERGAARVAERVRAAVAALGLQHESSPVGHVTISVGAATRRPSGLDAEAGALVDAADRALYEAKRSGRNRVCFEAFELTFA